jgi:hypothetical protein
VSSTRRLGLLATVLVVGGILFMVVPPLARDGICGIVGCADQVPDIAVTRPSPAEIVVLVPEQAAAAVRGVRLLEGGTSGARRWAIRRDALGSAADSPEAFVAGRQPDGFRTVTELDAPPGDGDWIAEVSFRCTTASLPFTPSTLTVGQVLSWSGATEGASFSDTARGEERCTVGATSAERWMLALGALMTVVGAVLGILWVLRRPPRTPQPVADDEPDGWSGPKPEGHSTP